MLQASAVSDISADLQHASLSGGGVLMLQFSRAAANSKSLQDEPDEELSRVLETAVNFLDEAVGTELKDWRASIQGQQSHGHATIETFMIHSVNEAHAHTSVYYMNHFRSHVLTLCLLRSAVHLIRTLALTSQETRQLRSFKIYASRCKRLSLYVLGCKGVRFTHSTCVMCFQKTRRTWIHTSPCCRGSQHW